MNHSSIEWSLKKKIKKEILKFEVWKNQSQKNQSQKSVSVKPRAGSNTQESNNPCIEWITVLLYGKWRRKSKKEILKFEL